MEIFFLIVILAVVLPRLKNVSTPKKFTDCGAKYYAPQLKTAASAAHLFTDDRNLNQKMLLAGLVGVGGAAMAVLMLCVLLFQAGNEAWLLYSVPSAIEYVAGLAEFGLLTAVFGKVSRIGFKWLERMKNYKLYREIINVQEMCPLADIARASGRSVETVRQDLKDMVQRGYFPFGFVDEDSGCFYANNTVWRLQNPERAKKQDEQSQRKKRTTKKTAQKKQEPVSDSEEFLKEMKRQLADIDNEEIREKAQDIYNQAEGIFAWVKAHPDCDDDVRRFCDYYLPTTIKLLKTYNEVEPHAASSEVAAGIQKEVSGVLDPVTAAFHNLLDNLLKDTAMDISVEVSALESVFNQDGLAQDQIKVPVEK